MESKKSNLFQNNYFNKILNKSDFYFPYSKKAYIINPHNSLSSKNLIPLNKNLNLKQEENILNSNNQKEENNLLNEISENFNFEDLSEEETKQIYKISKLLDHKNQIISLEVNGKCSSN